MTVIFRCGHRQDVPVTVGPAPVCPCGERVVSRVLNATPHFRGACSGPHAETVALEADARQISPSRLSLKPSTP